jgi:spore maturation protein CgeB
MKTISLVGSFNLADGYLGAAKALERKGHTVRFIPAAKYHHENDKTQAVQLIKNDLLEQSPDVVLWWRAEHLSAESLAEIKKAYFGGKFILYSWDDPLQWELHKEMRQKCQFLDVAFSCCMDTVQKYKSSGCDAYYCPPGFDPEIHYPEESEEHVCDISIVCTSLYHGNEITRMPHASRKIILDNIIKSLPGIDLKIYGLEGLEHFYPKHYAGWIPFDESRKVFHNSKISISTHIRPDGYLYINERVTQILGSKGLLLVDKVRGIEEVLEQTEEQPKAVVMKHDEYVDQIKHILSNYDDYKEIKERGYEKAMRSFTWDNWANTVGASI